MNGKQAKRLRREARDMTVGMPDREYHNARGTRRRKRFFSKKEKDVMFETSTIVMGNCTRKAYKLLKRNYKRGVK